MSSFSTTDVPSHPTQRPASNTWLVPFLLALVMLGGLLLRLPFWTAAAETSGWPLVLDEGNYYGLAEPLSQGEGIVDKWAWMRPPGYPAFIALFLILGLDPTIPSLLQIILQVLNIGLLYALTLEILHHHSGVARPKAQAAGLLAAGLLALNPQAAFYSVLLMPEALYMLALTIMAWALFRGLRLWRPASLSRASLLMLTLAGLSAAAAMYMRSAVQTFLPLMLGWLVWAMWNTHYRSRPTSTASTRLPFRPAHAFLPSLIVLGVIVAAVAPWTLRNYLTYNRFMVMDAVGGLNLWQYNANLSRPEILARLIEIPNPVDRDRYASEQGMRAILSDPLLFANSTLDRFAAAWPVENYGDLWTGFRNKYPGINCEVLDIFSWLSILFYVAFGLLVIWGFARAPGHTFKIFFLLFLLHYVSTTMLTHNEFRYRLPLYPYSGIFAGWGALALFTWQRKKETLPEGSGTNQSRRIAYLIAGVLSILFLIQCAAIALPGMIKSVRFERRYQEGHAFKAQGDYAGALASYLGAEEIERGCSCLYRDIGQAQGALGMRDAERASYVTALERDEYDWRAAALLSHNIRISGDISRAPGPIRATRPEYRTAQQLWAWENLKLPPITELDVGGADIGYVLNWHALETENGATYRWSKEKSAILLTVPLGSGAVTLSVRLHSLAWPGKPDPESEVRVSLNGKEVGTIRARPGWEWAELNLASLNPDQTVTIEFLTPTARPPGGETRLLGVAVDSVKLERKP